MSDHADPSRFRRLSSMFGPLGLLTMALVISVFLWTCVREGVWCRLPGKEDVDVKRDAGLPTPDG